MNSRNVVVKVIIVYAITGGNVIHRKARVKGVAPANMSILCHILSYEWLNFAPPPPILFSEIGFCMASCSCIYLIIMELGRIFVRTNLRN